MKGLTILDLQECLCREIEAVVKDMLLENPLGQQIPLRAFAQELPIEQIKGKFVEEDKDTADPFPYCVVRVEDGSMGRISTVNTNLFFGLFYDNQDRQGHARILTLIQRVYHRFAINPVLGNRFVQDGKIEWAINGAGEDMHPYYFGGMSVSWKIPGVEREDEFA